MVQFEDENGTDSDKAMENACRNLANFVWDASDIDFYFSQIEARMAAVGVKKQFTKCLLPVTWDSVYISTI